jgi:hypothetical protein
MILRFKNISDSKCYDSSNDNHGSTIIFSHSLQSQLQVVTSLATSTVDIAGLTTYVSQLDNYNKHLCTWFSSTELRPGTSSKDLP